MSGGFNQAAKNGILQVLSKKQSSCNALFCLADLVLL
jgi:hypothetical protein